MSGSNLGAQSELYCAAKSHICTNVGVSVGLGGNMLRQVRETTGSIWFDRGEEEDDAPHNREEGRRGLGLMDEWGGLGAHL